jgi:hypothetical protein
LGEDLEQKWSGAGTTKRAIDLRAGWVCVLTAVEVLDGFSSEWGASLGDIIANASGTALYVSRGIMERAAHYTKIFFSFTQYAQYRPNVLGSSFVEQILRITMGKPIGCPPTYILPKVKNTQIFSYWLWSRWNDYWK